jgi:hypothetical protein
MFGDEDFAFARRGLVGDLAGEPQIGLRNLRKLDCFPQNRFPPLLIARIKKPGRAARAENAYAFRSLSNKIRRPS